MCFFKFAQQGSGGDSGAHDYTAVTELPDTKPRWSNLLHHSARPKGLLVQKMDGETGEEGARIRRWELRCCIRGVWSEMGARLRNSHITVHVHV